MFNHKTFFSNSIYINKILFQKIRNILDEEFDDNSFFTMETSEVSG